MNAKPQNNAITALIAGMPTVEEQLPPWINVERFKRALHMAIKKNENAEKFQKIDQNSFLDAVVKCAMDGLLPDNNQATIIPQFDKKTGRMLARYSPMIGGLMFLARKSGEFQDINPVAVYENDHFEVFLGDNPRIEHKVCTDGSRGQVVAAYCIARMADGWVEREVITREQIDQVRKAASDYSAAWRDYYDQMACKVVFRRLAKRLPLSDQMDTAFEHDNEGYSYNRAAEPAVDAIAEPVAQPARKREATAIEHQPEPEMMAEGLGEFTEDDFALELENDQ
jgi:recombination protein RecT